LPADSRVAAVVKYLDDYEAGLGLPAIRVNETEVSHLLNLEPFERSKMDPYQCADAAYVLARFAAHLGRERSRQEALAVWLKSAVLKSVVREMQRQNAYSFEEKRQLAIIGNEHAMKLEQKRLDAEVKVANHGYLARHVENVGRAFEFLANVKRRQNEHA
jgi:hypothetical protein